MLVGTNFCQSTEISNNMVPTKIRYVIYVLSKHLASQNYYLYKEMVLP